MTRHPITKHGRDHHLNGADPIISPQRAYYQDAQNVPPNTFQPMGWYLTSGSEFLDISSPTTPVMLESGIYAVMFTAHGPKIAPSSGSVSARYFDVTCAFSLPDNTLESIDMGSHAEFFSNDVDGTPFTVIPTVDTTTENFQYESAHPERITILTNGIYRLRYTVGVNGTYFTPSQYQINILANGTGSLGDVFVSKAVPVDTTFDSADTSSDQAWIEHVYYVDDAPQTITFKAHQRSGNNWIDSGGVDRLGVAHIQLLKWDATDGVGPEVGTVVIDLDTAGDSVSLSQTFPLQEMERGALFSRPAAGTVTGIYYVPAGSGIDAQVVHSSETLTLNFDYEAVISRLW